MDAERIALCGHHMWGGDWGGMVLDILNERFARGEIDKDEYLDRKRTLES